MPWRSATAFDQTSESTPNPPDRRFLGSHLDPALWLSRGSFWALDQHSGDRLRPPTPRHCVRVEAPLLARQFQPGWPATTAPNSRTICRRQLHRARPWRPEAWAARVGSEPDGCLELVETREFFPGEIRFVATEMTVGGGVLINRTLQIEVAQYRRRAQVERLAHGRRDQ